MPITCKLTEQKGMRFCLDECPTATLAGSQYSYHRVEAPADLPPPESRAVDVAILDMNHAWPNLGHDSMVHAVQEATCNLLPALAEAGLEVRCLSFEVRQKHQIPEPPGGRFSLYLGTGGPGHIDPTENREACERSQGLHEDPGWERPTFALFDAILADPDASLIAVCHTYGVMCRWTGIARPEWRGAAKGGKSTGVLENLLTDEALRHPWFARFAAELPDGRRFGIVDNRLYDLVPTAPELPAGFTKIGVETLGLGGPAGDAMTMVEFARDRGGVMPRVFGSNHHPEIVHGERQKLILQQKLERGDVSREWYRERAEIVDAEYSRPDVARRLHRTSDYALLGPLWFHLRRVVRRRAAELGVALDVDENEILEAPVALG